MKVPFWNIHLQVGKVVGTGRAAMVSLYGLPSELPLLERLAVCYRQAMEDTVRNPELCPHRLYLRLLAGPMSAPLPPALHTHFTPVSPGIRVWVQD